MPLAVATPDSGGTVVLNWVHGNHLGVPIVTTDASGSAATTPNDYVAPGFPGQSRTLPDLYYNRYRDYDPSTGRYVQADPIGLAGGSNNYVYASANPLRWTDPLGLELVAPFPGFLPEVCLAGPIGALACGAVVGGELCYITPACRDAVARGLRKIADACGGGDNKPDEPCRTVSGKLVPVGTIAYRPLDTPSSPQHGIVGPHYNLYRANKNPNNGRCFWQSIGAVKPQDLPAGAIPIEPFAS